MRMNERCVKNALIENNKEILESIPKNYVFSDGTKLLHWASMYDNIGVFDEVANDMDVNVAGGQLGSTPLYYAIYNSNYKVMKRLIERGGDILYVNKSGLSLLYTCVRFDDVLGMILLLSCGADMNVKDVHGRTLWTYAKLMKSKRVMRFIATRIFLEGKKSLKAEFLLVGMHGGTLFMGKLSQALFTALVILFWKRTVIHTRFPVYLNMFYTLRIGWEILKMHPELAFLFLQYSNNLLKLVQHKPRFGQTGTCLESRSLIWKMIERDKYTEETFCYICLAQKSAGTSHCGVCNRCILNFNHHCPCVNMCIDKNCISLLKNCLILILSIAVLALLSDGSGNVHPELSILTIFVALVLVASIMA